MSKTRRLVGSSSCCGLLGLVGLTLAAGCGNAAAPEAAPGTGETSVAKQAPLEDVPPIVATVDGYFDGVQLHVNSQEVAPGSPTSKDPNAIPAASDPMTASLAQPLLDTPDSATYGSGVTGTGTQKIVLEQQVGSLSVYANNVLTSGSAWTLLGCGSKPGSVNFPNAGTCVRIRARNLFTSKMLTRAYFELTELTPTGSTTNMRVTNYNAGYTETGSLSADSFLGLNTVVGRWRYGSLEANTPVGGGSASWWAFLGTSAAGQPFTFSFRGHVRGNLVDPPVGDTMANGSAGRTAISGTGRYVAFASQATNLVAGTVNPVWRIYLADLEASTMTLMSTGPSLATPESCNSINPTISDDGMVVAFESTCAFTALDSNTVSDVYIRRVTAGDTTLASRTSTNTAPTYATGAQGSIQPKLSRAGDWIVFSSDAENLVPGRPTPRAIMDVYRQSTNPTLHTYIVPLTRIKNSPPTWANGSSYWPAIASSTYNTLVAFESDATNITTDTNGVRDVFLVNHRTGPGTTIDPLAVSLLSMAGLNAAVQLTSPSTNAFISVDGTNFGFTSAAAAFCTNAGNPASCVATGGKTQVYARGGAANTMKLVSYRYNSVNTPGNDDSWGGDTTGVGSRFVAFVSRATNLVPVTTSGPQVFVVDRSASQDRDWVRPYAVSHDLNFVFPVHGAIPSVSISADGRYVSYTSNGAPVAGASGTRAFRTPVSDRKSQ